MRIFIFSLLAIFFFTSVSSAQTKTSESPVRLLLKAALELGGDRVAQVYFTNGETQSVRAAQGLNIGAGIEVQITAEPRLLFHATLGFKYVTTQADNAHIRLTRIPIHVTANWMLANKFRIGGGLASHQGIRFNADGIAQDVQFKGATGLIFELAYSGIGLSYTPMKYTDQHGKEYAANAVGLTFTMAVRKNKQTVTQVHAPVD